MSTLDELAPIAGELAVGAPRLSLALADPTASILAFQPVIFEAGYDGLDPLGPTLPLVFQVVGPSPSSFRRQVFRRITPAQLVFVPEEGGQFTARLSEAFGNRAFAAVTFEAEGETADITA